MMSHGPSDNAPFNGFRATIILWTMAVFIIGLPSFITFDTNQITTTPQVNQNLILRGVLIVCVSTWVVASIVSYPRLPRSLIYAFRFPVLFYFGYFLSILSSSQSLVESIVSTIRIIEYFVYFLFLMIYFSMYRKADNALFNNILTTCAKYLIFIVLLSFWYLLFSPSSDGRLGMPVMHPNTLGILSLVSALTSFYLHKGGLRIFGVTFFLLACVMTFSKGAIVGLVLAFTLPSIIVSKRVSLKLWFLAITIGGVYLLWFLVSSGLFLRGQDVDYLLGFSGRLDVWESAYTHIMQSQSNTYLGIGFGEGSSIINEYMKDIFSITHWKTQNAHNDFLQAWLSGGVIFLTATLYVFWKSFLLSLSDIYPKAQKLFFLGLLVTYVWYSITMTSLNYYIGPVASLVWFQFIWLRYDLYRRGVKRNR